MTKTYGGSLKNGFVIVTRDADFEDMAIVKGRPPQVIWLKTSNQAKGVVLNMLLQHGNLKHLGTTTFAVDLKTGVVVVLYTGELNDWQPPIKSYSRGLMR